MLYMLGSELRSKLGLGLTFRVRIRCGVWRMLVRVTVSVMVKGYMLSKVGSGIVVGWI